MRANLLLELPGFRRREQLMIKTAAGGHTVDEYARKEVVSPLGQIRIRAKVVGSCLRISEGLRQHVSQQTRTRSGVGRKDLHPGI